MKRGLAIIRQHVAKIDGVTRTWFEWERASGDHLTKILVVEVGFPTDPNAPGFRPNVLDAIEGTVVDVLEKETTMVVSGLRIVPKDKA